LNHSKLEWLLLKYLEASSSREEKIWLMEYFNSGGNKKILNDFIKTELESAKDFESANEEKYNLEQILKKIMAAIRTAKHK
jgi:hypothetical protein